VLITLGGYAVFKSARVQTFITQKIVSYLSNKLHTKVTIGGVDIEFFDKLVLEDLYIQDHGQDTLIFAPHFKLTLSNLDLNNNIIQIGDVILEDAYVNLRKFKRGGDFNFQFIIDAFSGSSDTTKSKGAELLCNNISLKNCRLNYSLLYKKHGTWGIDWDYVKLRNLNLNLYSLHTYGDTINTYIKDLSFYEVSGFYVSNASCFFKAYSQKMHFKNFEAQSHNTQFEADIRFKYNSWADFDDFIERVKIDADIKRSKIDMADISYFAKELEGIKKEVYIEGLANGTVNNFTAYPISIRFGKKTFLKGKLRMQGLPDAENTLIDFKIKQLQTNKEDIEGIPLPPFTSKEYIQLPEEIYSMGEISYVGEFTGFYNNFVTYGAIKSDIGLAKTDLKINYNLETEITEYSGKINTQNFNMRKLLNNNLLGFIDANLTINGKGFTVNSLDASAKGNIRSVDFNNYHYQNIMVDGNFKNKYFKGKCLINDINLFMDFDGDINLKEAKPLFGFNAKVENANLDALGFYNNNNEPFKVSSYMEIDLKGNNLDDFVGNVSLEDLKVETLKGEYSFGEILINANEELNRKKLILVSDMIDARVTGNYNFENILPSIKQLINYHFPNLFNTRDVIANKTFQDFSFNVKLKSTTDLSELFMPDVVFLQPSTIDGRFNNLNRTVDLNANIPEANLYGVHLYQYNASLTGLQKEFSIKNNIAKATLNDSIAFKNVQIHSYPWNNQITTNLKWDNKEKFKNAGEIEGKVAFNDSSNTLVSLTEASVFIRDTNWILKNPGSVAIDTSKIKFSGLEFGTGTQKINVNGIISKNPADQLFISLDHFIIENLNPLLISYDVQLAGQANGFIKISDVYRKPVFNSELDFKDFVINDENFGHGKIFANYDDSRRNIKMEGNLSKGNLPTIKFTGMYFPFKKEDDLEFSINLNKTQLKILQRFTTGVLSDLRGYATGDVLIVGSSFKPELYGKVEILKGGFKVDYLNTAYSFNGNLNIKPEVFEVVNAEIFDEMGNLSHADFKMYHQNFRNFGFDIAINAQNLMVLNTTLKDNDLFYGKAFSSGLMKIKGPTDLLEIDIAARTEKGTQLFIPYSDQTTVSENSFVRFVNKDTAVTVKKIQKTDLTGLQMNFDLEVTPEAQFQMVFDSKVGDVIKGRGEGNIKMEINTNGLFNMYGDYRFTEGDYLFTFENAINKRFKIEPGSIISWNGDPYNANIDIATVYKTKTALSTLLQDSSAEYKRNIPVNVMLKLKDKLFNPSISFGINFPTQSNNETLKAQVNSIIGNDNNNELNRQVFALLMIGSFIPPSGGSQAATRVQQGIGNSSAELLSAQFNNWISQLSKNVNLGVNYKPSTDLTSRQIELAISTQLFNDRLSIDGNFGVANNQQTAAASSLVDVNVEYKLTNNGKFRVKAYNKPNDFINYFTQGYNRQGVGLIYKEEFYTIGELISRKRKKSINNSLPLQPKLSPDSLNQKNTNDEIIP
jgi:hypothetical protein